jgi:hypothetical protein
MEDYLVCAWLASVNRWDYHDADNKKHACATPRSIPRHAGGFAEELGSLAPFLGWFYPLSCAAS